MTWEDAWREGRTGWDAGHAAPALLDLLQHHTDLPAPGRALVPGCGAGYDAMALARAGWQVTGLDLAPTAAERFEVVRQAANVAPSAARIQLADFFTITPDGSFDLVWDYTFLCAIEPTQREAWASHMRRWLTTRGELVTLIFPIHPGQEDTIPSPDQGPPFAMSPRLVRSLVEPLGFNAHLLEPARSSHPGREGMEWLGRWRLG